MKTYKILGTNFCEKSFNYSAQCSVCEIDFYFKCMKNCAEHFRFFFLKKKENVSGLSGQEDKEQARKVRVKRGSINAAMFVTCCRFVLFCPFSEKCDRGCQEDGVQRQLGRWFFTGARKWNVRSVRNGLEVHFSGNRRSGRNSPREGGGQT